MQKPSDAAEEVGGLPVGDAELLGLQQRDEPPGGERGLGIRRNQCVNCILVRQITRKVFGNLQLPGEIPNGLSLRILHGALQEDIAAFDLRELDRIEHREFDDLVDRKFRRRTARPCQGRPVIGPRAVLPAYLA